MTAFQPIARALAPAALILTAAPALAQDEPAAATFDTGRMIEIVEEEAGPGNFMGAVLVAHGDEPVLERTWGSANLEWDIPHTPDTKFRIGSVTKQFTSVAALLLQQQGKLDLDAPIATYLEDTPEAWNAVSVRHLMRHTSGIPSFTQLEEFERAKYLPLSHDELIALFADKPLEFAPGTSFAYSNSGYALLSKIIENVSGQSLGEYWQAEIFDPLGMADTGVDVSAAILPKRASGYSRKGDGKTVMNADYAYMGTPWGAGAMVSTTGDLLKWQRGLFGGRLLDADHLAEYLTPSAHGRLAGDAYAHGVLIDTSEAGRFYWHDGGIEGFAAWLSHDPDRNVTVAVLANLNGGAASKIGEQLTMVAQGREVILTSDRTVIDLPVKALAQYEGTYALSPDFRIAVFLEGDRLMTQATGQDAFEIFPEGADRFFLKVIDAQLRFERGADGAITGATLFQNGREFPATRE
ncbi:MAG: serine hydrolase [Erythrobacter sp.]|jgi:CubicO group peptidase (beta-lactamase class C family)|nr:serine hydrolase [Erythrobacter sp.]